MRFAARSIHPSSVVALLLLCCALSSRASKIDDFEAGAFDLSTNSTTSGAQGALNPIHCIAATRSVELQTGGDFVGATLNLGAVDDELALVMGATDAFCRLLYLPAPTDLTDGGIFDAVRVRLTTAAATGASLRLTLGDALGGQSDVTLPITGPGNHEFLHADYPALDVQQITLIQLDLISSAQGDYHISDIAMWKAGAKDAQIEVLVPNFAGPPYPTSAIEIMIRHLPDQGDPVDLLKLFLSVDSVTGPNGSESPSEIVAMDSGGPGEAGGGQMIAQAGSNAFSKAARLHVGYWIGLRQTAQSQGLLQIETNSAHLDFPSYDESALFFSQFVGVLNYFARPEGGSVRYSVHMRVPFVANAAAGLAFKDVVQEEDQAIPNSSRLSFGLELVQPEKMPTALEYEIIPLTAMVEELAVTSAPIGGPRRLQLSARPSVMASSTRIWLDQALGHDLDLTVYDLAGRALRKLTIGATRLDTTWDGLDARGVPVAAGIYYVRAAEGAGPPAVAKLVKLE